MRSPRLLLALAAVATLSFAAAVTIALPPIVSEEVLEPSVQNEVDHAIATAPAEAWTVATNAVPAVTVSAALADPHGRADPFLTNGLSRTAIALKLVSAQRRDGRWLVGTNDMTVTALRILIAL